MSLKKITFKPGVNRERTRYTNEGGWFDCDKIRFRQGSPEKIGGWTRISDNTFDGKARSLRAWTTLGNIHLVGVGTHKKFYVEEGARYYDITPVRKTTRASDRTINLARTDGSSTITVTDTGHGAEIGDFVTFAGFTTLGGGITMEKYFFLPFSRERWLRGHLPVLCLWPVGRRERDPIGNPGRLG